MKTSRQTDKDLVQDLLTSVPEYIQKVEDQTDEKTQPFSCAVITCSNSFVTYKKHLKATFKFHNFPSNQPKFAKKWLEACGLSSSGDQDVKSLKVCSDHFELDDYIRNYKEEIFNPNFKRKLFEGAVPHIKIPHSKKSAKQSPRINIVSFHNAKPLAKGVSRNKKDENNTSENAASKQNQVETNQIETELQVDFIIKEPVNSIASNDKVGLNVLNKQKYYTTPENTKNPSYAVEELVKLRKIKQALEKDVNTLQNKVKHARQMVQYKRKKLQTLKAKGFKQGVYKLVKEGVFTRAQLMFLLGRKKVIWSDDDYASAFTLRHYAGKEAYLYMKNELRWPLPSLRSVQIWAASD